MEPILYPSVEEFHFEKIIYTAENEEMKFVVGIQHKRVRKAHVLMLNKNNVVQQMNLMTPKELLSLMAELRKEGFKVK